MMDEPVQWCDDWMAQLGREEAVMAAGLASVRRVGSALNANDHSALAAAVAAQAEVIATLNNVCKHGHSLRQRLVADSSLGTKAIHTVEGLTPAIRAELNDRVRRLRELAVVVERQNRCNAFVVRQSLRFVRRLLGVLVGACDSGERYSAAGIPQKNATGSILNVRG